MTKFIKISTLALAMTLLAPLVWAQGVFKFEEEVHTFDAIIEGEVATHDFKFTNVGDQPIIVSHVQPACGCTAPSWTREPVAPGKQGTITVAYNSAGRPGPYTKTVTISSNAKPGALALTFKGVVLKKPEEVAATEAAKANSPKLLLDKQTIALGKLEVGQTANAKFIVKNTGKSDLKILDVQSACMCTGYKLDKTDVAPGESTTLTISYKANSMGNANELVYIATNEIGNQFTKVNLQAQVVDKLAPASMVKEGASALPFK